MPFYPTYRLFGVDVAVFGVTDTLSTDAWNLLFQFQNLELSIEHDLMDNAAVQDLWEYPVVRRQRWRIPVTLAVEGFAAVPNAFNVLMLQGRQVAVTLSNVGAGSGGINYSGYALVTNVRHGMGDGGQTISMELIGQGPLTPTAITYSP